MSSIAQPDPDATSATSATSAATEVDHVVINALFELDAACVLFAALGFAVSPRGYHSLGSMNHLIMSSGAYLELVGVPRSGLQRADVLNSPRGLSGLVFKSQDADTTYARLVAEGLTMLAPLDFSRPVSAGGVARDARFRIVRAAPECFPAGRIYFCQHLTPELVWNGEGLDHANGFRRLVSMTVRTTRLARDRTRYASVTSAAGKWKDQELQFQLGDFTLDLAAGEQDEFRGLELEFDNLVFLENAAAALPGVIWHRVNEHHATLQVPDISLNIECRCPAASTGVAD
jgi:hypothetical protein